jgi:hypothetical protein
MHIDATNVYYYSVIECVKCSVSEVIPVKTVHCNNVDVPGRNDYVQDKYNISRKVFLNWVSCGRLSNGAIFSFMSHSRASFKLAL